MDANAVAHAMERNGSVPVRHPCVVPIVVGHALLMVAWSILRHRHFGSAITDLGAYDNVFWNFAHRGTLWNSPERVHQWSNHLEVGLVWLWLPYRIAPSPIWLFLLQQISCAAAALPVESIVRHASGRRELGLVAAVAMLLTPQLMLAEIYDFHSITACAFPMALLAWGIERDRGKWIAVAALILLSIREQMGLAVEGAAFAWAIRHGWRDRWRYQLALGASGITVFLTEVLWLIPSFAGGQLFRYAVQYGRLGGSPGAALRFAITHPFRFALLPFEGGRLFYLLLLACGSIPLVFLSLRSPRRAAWPLFIAAPLLAVQLFNDNPLAWNIHYQYGAPIVPILAACAGLTLAGAMPHATRTWHSGIWLGGTLVAACFATFVKLVGEGRPFDPEFPSSPRAVALSKVLRVVPDDAAVSALDRIGPHLAHRPTLHVWPGGEDEDRFVVLEAGGMREEPEERRFVAAGIARLRDDPRFTVRFEEAGVIAFEAVPKQKVSWLESCSTEGRR
jgi:uncharacterized membrane protein